GFTSTAKTAKALRFEQEGQVFFRKRVRVRGRHYYEEWLAMTPPIVEAIYEASFYNIKELTNGGARPRRGRRSERSRAQSPGTSRRACRSWTRCMRSSLRG